MNSIIDFLITHQIDAFIITYMFVIIGAYIKDYADTLNEKDTKVHYYRIILFSFILSMGVWSQGYRFNSEPFYLFMCCLAGLGYQPLINLAIKIMGSEEFIKKVVKKIFLNNIDSLLDLKDKFKDN